MAKERGFQPSLVAFDSWYSSLENLKLARDFGWDWLTKLKENRQVSLQAGEQQAISELGPSSCGVFLNLIPVFGVALSLTFLHEQLFPHHVLGAICVTAGIALAQIKWQPRTRLLPT